MNGGEKIKSYASSPQSIMSFMDNSADSWVIKDTESRWIYANNVALDLCNVEKGFDIEGKLDKEIHYPAQEMWESFVACDQRVVAENRKISEVAIHYYGKC